MNKSHQLLGILLFFLSTTIGQTISQTLPQETTTKKDEYAPLDIIPFRAVTDIDPKIVAFRTFSKFNSPQPEGLKSESISVSYAPGKAVVTHTITGLADDSISGLKYRLEMGLTAGQWQLTWAGKQQKCRKDNKWTKARCG